MLAAHAGKMLRKQAAIVTRTGTTLPSYTSMIGVPAVIVVVEWTTVTASVTVDGAENFAT